jgi:hypothetical protein
MRIITAVCLATVLVVPGLLKGGDARFSIEKEDDGVVIKIGGQIFTRYHELYQNKPILHPVNGPTGKPMTRPLGEGDHPHHSSLWFTHGNVNGTDFWHLKGLIQHQEYLQMSASSSEAVLKTKAAWIDPQKKMLGSEIRTVVFGADEGIRWMDIECVFRAEQDVTFGRTKEGSFGARVWPAITVDKGGTIVNSRGDADKDAWGKAAEWVDYSGEIDGERLGIAILNHPGSLRHPTTWHVRTYGLFASNPFMQKPLELKPGESITVRHLVVLHSGTAKEAGIARLYEEFAGTKK